MPPFKDNSTPLEGIQGMIRLLLAGHGCVPHLEGTNQQDAQEELDDDSLTVTSLTPSKEEELERLATTKEDGHKKGKIRAEN